MKANVNKDNCSNKKEVCFSYNNENNLNDNDYSCLTSLIFEIFDKKRLIDRATFYSSKNILSFKKIAHKKTIEKNVLYDVYKIGIQENEVVLKDYSNIVISLINKDIKTEKNFKLEYFKVEDELYNEAIQILNKYLKFEFIECFLKLVGFKPTDKQKQMIEKLEIKTLENKKIKEEIEKSLNEYKKPIENSQKEMDEKINRITNDIHSWNKEIVDLKKQQQVIKKHFEELIQENKNSETEALKIAIDFLKNKQEEINKHFEELIRENKNSEIEAMKISIEVLKNKQEEIKKYFEDLLQENENSEIEALKKSLDIMENSRKSFENRVSKFEKVEAEFLKEFNDFFKKINSEISEINEKLALNSKNKNTKLHIISSKKIVDEIKECGEISEFERNLKSNFELLGINEELKSIYISTMLFSSTIPLFCGFYSREIVTVLSITMFGETPLIISSPIDDNDFNEIIDIYENTASKVILIEDAIGNMNERKLLALFRDYRGDFDNKKNMPFIFLSCESKDDLEFISKSFFYHVTLVMFDEPIIIKNIKYIKGYNSQKAFLKVENEENEENEVFKDLRRKGNLKLDKIKLSTIYYRIKASIIKESDLIDELIENEIKYFEEKKHVE